MGFLGTLGKIALTGAGTALGGPLGGAAGAALGGALFKDRSKGGNAAAPAVDPLRASLQQQATGPLTGSATYQAGVGQMQAQQRTQAQADAGGAAARGLAGGEFEIAQAAQRGQQATAQQNALMQQASGDRGAAQSRLMQLMQQGQNNDLIKGQQRGQTAGAIANVASSALPAILRLVGG